MHICQGLALDTEACRSPGTCTDEDRSVAVAEEVLHKEVATQNYMGPYLYAQFQQLITEAVQQAVRQAIIGDAITEHTTDHVPLLKDRNAVSGLGKDDCNSHASGATADDGDGVLLIGWRGSVHAVKISIRDKFFDLIKLDRVTLFPLDAVAHTLVPMVADD